MEMKSYKYLFFVGVLVCVYSLEIIKNKKGSGYIIVNL